jgi:hypothetical protein
VELEEVAKEIDAHIGPHRFGRCAVVTEQALLFGSMQMFEVLVVDCLRRSRSSEARRQLPIWLAPKPDPTRH